MTTLQKQAVNMVMLFTDDNDVIRLIDYMNTLSPKSKSLHKTNRVHNMKRDAFIRLNAASENVKKYYPDGLDAETEFRT